MHDNEIEQLRAVGRSRQSGSPPAPEPRRRLYLISGVMVLGNHFEILPGLLLAASKDEARGAHVRFMKEKLPGYLMHSIQVTEIPDDLVREAYAEIPPARLHAETPGK